MRSSVPAFAPMHAQSPRQPPHISVPHSGIFPVAVEICGRASMRAGDMFVPTARAVAPVAAAATTTTLLDIITEAIFWIRSL
mmetsp:Transcript_2444/g.4990  ORF Transcript_2444/g.4990 Transcript_2444/m.4990 type:complete len:82 (+) Transcript_2444:743-988(+)